MPEQVIDDLLRGRLFLCFVSQSPQHRLHLGLEEDFVRFNDERAVNVAPIQGTICLFITGKAPPI